MKTINDAFITKVSRLMKDRKLCKYRLSVKSAIPKSTVHNILTGITKSANLEHILNICWGLDVQLAEFFDDELFLFENLSDD